VPDFELVWAVRDFVERGGNVLFAIAIVTAGMWALIIERFFYFRFTYQAERASVLALWNGRPDHSSWNAHQIRRMLVSESKLKLERGLSLIKTAVALCPMFGLLGTVTGMIEVFDVMAIAGSGNARGMASGVSKATLPTMAGMVAALSGMLFSIQIDRYAQSESERLASNLELREG
jgi:biopolymer transport protein ExbB